MKKRINGMENILKPGERLDDLQRNGYHIIQHPGKFCFGMDAVLLSDFVRVKKHEKVLDLGTGTGIIPILLEAKTEGEHFIGIEIQQDMAEMARRSIKYNSLEEKISVIDADIKKASEHLGRAVFDVVTANPPYMNEKHGLKNPQEAKAIARHEILCKLEDVIREGAAVLKPGGRFYMVHRPHRIAEIFHSFHQHHMEPKRMRLVHPYADSQANMVLIEAVKGGNSWLKVEAPLIVFRECGVYTEELNRIYHWS